MTENKLEIYFASCRLHIFFRFTSRWCDHERKEFSSFSSFVYWKAIYRASKKKEEKKKKKKNPCFWFFTIVNRCLIYQSYSRGRNGWNVCKIHLHLFHIELRIHIWGESNVEISNEWVYIEAIQVRISECGEARAGMWKRKNHFVGL